MADTARLPVELYTPLYEALLDRGDYIDALVRAHVENTSALEIDWQGQAGSSFVEDILRAVYDQLEEWQ